MMAGADRYSESEFLHLLVPCPALFCPPRTSANGSGSLSDINYSREAGNNASGISCVGDTTRPHDARKRSRRSAQAGRRFEDTADPDPASWIRQASAQCQVCCWVGMEFAREEALVGRFRQPA